MKLFKTAWAPVALALFALPLATACSSDDEEEPSNKRRTISVVVSENPMQNESADARSTRADITTSESFSSFKMIYQADAETNTPYTATKSGTPARWGVSPDTWPIYDDNEKIIFYAYNGDGTFVYNNGNPYISFTMGKQPANLVDFMAANTNTSYDDHSGQVPLAFSHACAAVQFYVYSVDGQTYSVKRITLKNVKNQGNYYYKSNSWTLSEDTYDYLLTESSITPTTDDQRLPCGWMFLIPQSKDAIGIEVRFTKNGISDELTKTLSLPSGSWAAGTRYSVRIRIGNAPQS